MPAFEQLPNALRVHVEPLALEKRALVVGEAEPLETVEDRVDEASFRALAVGVLDAQHKGAAVVSSEKPIEQSCTGAP
jgi:hypothetical protein